jgi:hypothetical protein
MNECTDFAKRGSIEPVNRIDPAVLVSSGRFVHCRCRPEKHQREQRNTRKERMPGGTSGSARSAVHPLFPCIQCQSLTNELTDFAKRGPIDPLTGFHPYSISIASRSR